MFSQTEKRHLLRIFFLVFSLKVPMHSAVCSDIRLPKLGDATSGIVSHEGQGLTALGDYKIIPGDRIVVCCLPRSIKRIERLFL